MDALSETSNRGSPSRNKKRRRILLAKKDEPSCALKPKDGPIPSTIRALMGHEATIFRLFDFVRYYAPNLPNLEPHLLDTKPELATSLRNTQVCPLPSLQKSRCSKVECIESLPSLVDDVVWALVQRRRQRRSTDKQARNVLSQGYVLASEQFALDQQMRPGVVCRNMNDLVSYIKTSDLMQALHKLVGDDVVRALLLHTSVFVPVGTQENDRNVNHVLLCGPPLRVAGSRLEPRKRAQEPNDSSHDRVKKRRRRSRRMETPQSQPKDDINDQKMWSPNAVLPLHSLFYSGSYIPTVGLSSTHILNQQPPKCRLLLSTIIGSHRGRRRWKRVREMGHDVCQQLFRLHAKCDYHRLLNRYCSLPEICNESQNDTSWPRVTLAQLSASHSSLDGVVSFLRAVLRHAFPSNFWGSEHNLERVMDAMKTFVKLRRREQLPYKALTHGMRVKDVGWIVGASAKEKWSKTLHEAATTRLQNVMKWVFVNYLIPLLRSVFYITESEFSAKRVLYYRKPVWAMFRSLTMKKLLVEQYKEISRKEAAALVATQRMGFSRLRLLPKASGVRPVVTLSKREFVDFERGVDDAIEVEPNAKSRGEMGTCMPPSKRLKRDMEASQSTRTLISTRRLQIDKRFSSTNAVLGNVFEVLRHERGRKPNLFGAGVFGLNEVYPKYRCFLEKVKLISSQSMLPNLFFVTVDVQQCYDSINQEHLLEILPNLLSESEYLIQNYSVIHPSESMGRVLKKQVKRIGPPESYTPFQNAVGALESDYSRSVFTSGGGCVVIQREDAMELLREHLRSHVVVVQGRYGERFLLQTTGIPQGSVLSTLLCNYYYGHVEKDLLYTDSGLLAPGAGHIANEDHATLLVRIVDDFLLITTNMELSRNFLTIMSNGSDKLGVHINKAKTMVTDIRLLPDFDATREAESYCLTGTSDKCKENVFPWCGMLFHTKSGEMSVDYSRFAHGKSIDALTIDRAGGEGRQLEIRMKSFVRPRCQPLLFDLRINSARTVGINFTQALLLCAGKTLGYLQGLSGASPKNNDYILRCIDDVVAYSYELIATRLQKENPTHEAPACQNERLPGLKRPDAMWLGCRAFRVTFHGIRGYENLVELLSSKNGRPTVDNLLSLQEIAGDAIREYESQIGVVFKNLDIKDLRKRAEKLRGAIAYHR